MATITITRNSTLPNTANKTDFYNLIDTATAVIADITGADVSSIASANKVSCLSLFNAACLASIGQFPYAAIANSITSGQYVYYDGASLVGVNVSIPSGSVSGINLTNLSSTPSAAGRFPSVNLALSLASGQYAYYDGTDIIGASVSVPVSYSGIGFTNLLSTPTTAGMFPSFNLVQSLASGQYAYYNGSTLIGANVSAAAGSAVTRGTFNYGSLVSGVASIAHNLALTAPFSLNVGLIGASSSGYQTVFPDSYAWGTNAFSVNMLSYITQSNASVYYGYVYSA
jgi:hypothetical protein